MITYEQRWQPGVPLHRRTGRANPGAPMFTLKTEFSMADAARWPDPLPWHDLDTKGGQRVSAIVGRVSA